MINSVAFGGASAMYVALAALVAFQARRSRTALLLAFSCLVSAVWLASAVVSLPGTTGTMAGLAEMLRSLAWYGFLLHVYRRALPGRGPVTRLFDALGAAAVVAVCAVMVTAPEVRFGAMHLFSATVALRIGLAVANLLLIENLYRNVSEDTRWNVNLLCIALASTFLYDIVMVADVVLFRHQTEALATGRAIAAGLVVPLLAVGAARNRKWDVRIHVSRAAALHTATLMASGLLLLGLAAVGELFRFLGASWATLAEICLVFGGLLTSVTLATSGSARSRLRSVVVDHFFTHRYDYRQEWIHSIDTLSAADIYVPLHTRVLRAVAAAVDSPGGVLMLQSETGFVWAGSWNMPAVTVPMAGAHPVASALAAGAPALVLTGAARVDLPEGVWLAVGLSHGERLVGIALMASPRAPFKLDGEVFALLSVIGRQAAAYLAEQRATELLLEARALHDFGKRFAFVAHDIKNVSSQLSMLLSNAELHLSNPEFQRDMLATVRASVQRIGGLLRKLQAPESEAMALSIEPAERLGGVIAGSPRFRAAGIRVTADGRGCAVSMKAQGFDAVITHLLDNALDAASETGERPAVRVNVAREAHHVVVDIIDEGPGMTADFVRDRLFRPFETSKRGGSGIGAWQARELAREAGGDLLALSVPGRGTTMRIILPALDAPLAGGERQRAV